MRIQEYLSELIGIAHDGGEIGTRGQVHVNLVGAQGMFVELQGAQQQVRQVQQGVARSRGARENQQALYDVRGAARLAMSEVQLAAGVFVGGLVAQQLGNAQNGGQRIVEFVGHAGNHLAHGCEPLRLNELLLEPLLVGNVARRSDRR